MTFSPGPQDLGQSDGTPTMHLGSSSSGAHMWHQLANQSLGSGKDPWGKPNSDL